LVLKGLTESREKGKALIMAGQVFVNGIKVDKPGAQVKKTDILEVKGKAYVYVSRGGLKLEKALQVFDLDLKGKTIMDIGASTGGFTHCALLRGASKVYAVDVGYGQLDWSLRQDPRVINLERKNARYLTKEDINELVDIITVDVSFISLEKILPAVTAFLKDGGLIVALIKPQFEAGRENVGKKGVVRDKNIHKIVISNIIEFSISIGLRPIALDYSPVKGPEGNVEFLLCLEKNSDIANDYWEDKIAAVVEEAHKLP